MDFPNSYLSQAQLNSLMPLTVEEINLICVYDTSNRYTLIAELEEALPYTEEPELLALLQAVLRKLYTFSDQQFAALPLYPAEEEEEE